MVPAGQERHKLGLFEEQVMHEGSQRTHVVFERPKPERQPVQTVVEEQEEQPAGQMIAVVPTTALAMLISGL